MMYLTNRIAIFAVAAALLAQSPGHAKSKKDKQQPQQAPAAATATAQTQATPPAPLSESDNFFRAEGAHFENMYETWELYGDLRDQDGKRYDLSVFFGQSGGAYMNVRFGYSSFLPDGGERYYTSFVPATFKEAAIRQLKSKLLFDPENTKLKETLDLIDKGEIPHYDPFDKTADVYRTILFIDYGKNRFVRISRTKFQYSLQLNVQNNRISGLLESSGDPMQFNGGNIIGGEDAAFAMMGYVFPEMKLTATLIMPDSKVKTITGRVIFAHFWCDPDRGMFSRYNIMSLPLDDGRGLYNFTFMSPNGKPMVTRTYMSEKDGTTKLLDGADVKETEWWTSDFSGLTYPKTWSVSAPGLSGGVNVPDTRHELSVMEGIGSFYLGPCEFEGAGGAPRSRGMCRLIAPEKQ